MTVPDTSENAAANLAWTDITLPSPVFVGDTLWAESEILEKRESKSNPDVGIVDDALPRDQPAQQVVIEYRRTFMVYKRTAPQAERSFPGTDRGMEDVMATAAERFAQFALELDLDAVPDDVVEAAKLHVLDVIGCGLAAHGLGIAGEGRATMSELGGAAEASVIGLDSMLPAPNAAFANAMLCHGLDFDDTHSDSVAHVSTVVVPAAAALAEARGASGRELLTAIIAGNEVVTRIGMATPGAFHRRGFHPTAICGIFGAAAAAARLNGLDTAADR